ncbi:MAG: hypothetical protein WDZ79_01220 [Candidatus Paceibacterota bacterium]
MRVFVGEGANATLSDDDPEGALPPIILAPVSPSPKEICEERICTLRERGVVVILCTSFTRDTIDLCTYHGIAALRVRSSALNLIRTAIDMATANNTQIMLCIDDTGLIEVDGDDASQCPGTFFSESLDRHILSILQKAHSTPSSTQL